MELRSTLRAHSGSVAALELSTYGLWSGDEIGWIVWWDLGSRRPKAIWRAHTNAILAIIWLPGGYLVTHGRDMKLRVWKLDTTQKYEVKPLNPAAVSEDYPKPWLEHSQDVNALNFCGAAISNKLIAVPATTSSEAVDVYLQKPFSRPFKALLPPGDSEIPYGTVMSLAWLSETELVAGFESGGVVVWRNGEVVAALRPHRQPVLTVNTVGNRIWTTAADSRICSFTLDGSDTISVTKINGGRGLSSLKFAGDTAVSTGWDGLARIYNILDDGTLEQYYQWKAGRQNGITVCAFGEGPPAPPRQLRAWSQRFLAVGGKDGRIGLYTESEVPVPKEKTPVKNEQILAA